MPLPLVMTVIGRDRPGLVQQVARVVNEHGGNWLESRMSHLGGQFAGILRVVVPPDRETDLVRALQTLHQEGLTVVVHQDSDTAAQPEGKLVLLEVVGHDRPGIVRQISQSLANQSVNVEELETACTSAPMSGEPLFQARARLRIPPHCDLIALRQQLETIAADLFVECRFAEIE